MISIDVRNLQNSIKIDEKKIIKCAMAVLNKMDEAETELSLLLVNDAYIKRLNRRYRKVDSATDVLAFPIRTDEGFTKNSAVLGDVVISLETAGREAKKRRASLWEEVRLYLVHGILHLLGYDDMTQAGKNKMDAKQKQLLEAL